MWHLRPDDLMRGTWFTAFCALLLQVLPGYTRLTSALSRRFLMYSFAVHLYASRLLPYDSGQSTSFPYRSFFFRGGFTLSSCTLSRIHARRC